MRRAAFGPVAAALLAALLLISCERSTEPVALGLVWSDEFDGPAGQSPDGSNWLYDLGTGSNGWGNAQLEYDTNRPENVSLDGEGNLVITAREEAFSNRNYTSARIKTQGKFERTRGRFEARIKLPIGQGLWPAFWMLGNDIPTAGWPDCGEIDIMEYRGQYPSVVSGALHGPGYSGASPITERFVLPEGDFHSDFHIFAIEWDRDSITWYVDETPYLTVKVSDLGGRRWVFDHPFFIILNVAVGGYFVGDPDASTVFPQSMIIDYVRVYNNGD